MSSRPRTESSFSAETTASTNRALQELANQLSQTVMQHEESIAAARADVENARLQVSLVDVSQTKTSHEGCQNEDVQVSADLAKLRLQVPPTWTSKGL